MKNKNIGGPPRRKPKMVTLSLRMSEDTAKHLIAQNELGGYVGARRQRYFEVPENVARMVVTQAAKSLPELREVMAQEQKAFQVLNGIQDKPTLPARMKKRLEAIHNQMAKLRDKESAIHRQHWDMQAAFANKKLREAGVTLWRTNNGSSIMRVEESDAASA